MSTADQPPSMPPLPEAFCYHNHFAWMQQRSTECVIKITRRPQQQYGYVHALYTAEQVQAVADERVRAALQRGFEAGWRSAATWMERDDLAADVGSPVYIADRDRALARSTLSLERRTPTMADRYAALREALEAGPTPGPWSTISRGQYWGEEEGDVHGPDGQDIDGAEFVPRVRYQETTRGQAWMRDTAFIAAADPDTIRALLATADRYEWLRSGARMRQGIPTSGHRTISRDQLRGLMEFNFWCTPDELDAAIDAARATHAPP